jgi:hypothetical protein
MVSLTIKNGFDLAERYEHWKTSWSAMIAAARKAKSNPKKNPPLEWNKVLGSVRSIEVTKSKVGEWHPHGHAFCLLDSYIDRDKLIEEWKHFTGDSWSVDVRACKNGIIGGLIETLKYSTKFSSMAPEDIYTVHQALNGRRLVDSLGLLRGVNIGDLDEDDTTGLTGPFRDLIASWQWNEMRYSITPVSEIKLPERPFSLSSL